MIILNTTFFAEEPLTEEISRWLASVYLPAIHESGLFESAECARVLEPAEPGAVSFACRCVTHDLSAARRWHDDTAALLRDDLSARWGQRVVWFTTYMEVI
ncbi:MAG: DUF4286 family protein [Muribaculaceae bacterium]|nr:DUF4286 family protein [Muribaculaceae bacterium]